jgi:hypothetical protein
VTAVKKPTPDDPGLHVSAPPIYRSHNDGARWSTHTDTTPTGSYACRCGETAEATGRTQVAALVKQYEEHKAGHAKGGERR